MSIINKLRLSAAGLMVAAGLIAAPALAQEKLDVVLVVHGNLGDKSFFERRGWRPPGRS